LDSGQNKTIPLAIYIDDLKRETAEAGDTALSEIIVRFGDDAGKLYER